MTIIHAPIKKRIKQFIPPILTNKIIYFRNYFNFLKYKDLLLNNIKLKNIHKGERCFILGSGPSIINEDIMQLQNEIVFALNNFYVHPDFSKIMSGNKDNYYITAPIHPPQTEKEWKDWLCDMEENMPKNTTMIFGLNRDDTNIKCYNSGELVMQNCRVSHSNRSGILSVYSNLTLNESTSHDNNYRGIFVDYTTADISGNEIYNNSSDGMYVNNSSLKFFKKFF